METKYKSMYVDKEWIDSNIEKPGWQRILYPSRVNSFITHIMGGTFRKSLITVAKRNDEKYILLDGQHKLEAISKSKKKVMMDIKIITGISEEEMVKEYTVLNDVKAHRLIDDIKLHVGKNEILDSFMDSSIFPINVTLSGGVNSIRIDRFLNILSNSSTYEITRKNLTRKIIHKFIDELTTLDFMLMKGFCSFYKNCFGDPDNSNWMYKNIVLMTIIRFWLKNKEEYNDGQMIVAFKKIYKEEAIHRESYSVDLVTQKSLTYKILDCINKGRSKNLFKKYWKDLE